MPNNNYLSVALRHDLLKIRLGRDAAAAFTQDRVPPENGVINLELVEEAAAYLAGLEGFAGDQLARQEFARALVEWAESYERG